MAEQLLPMPEDWHRALVIVAHPDDAEWGTATAIAGWTSAGKQVAYVLATRGEAGIDTLPPERAGPLREAEQPDAGNRVRWVAVSSSPLASHAVDISARRDRGIASLAAHRSYLLSLSDEPPEQHAARLIDELTASDPDIFDGRSYLSFELLTL